MRSEKWGMESEEWGMGYSMFSFMVVSFHGFLKQTLYLNTYTEAAIRSSTNSPIIWAGV